MDRPSKRPEQKLTLTEANRIARDTLFLLQKWQHPFKRLTLVGTTLMAGIGLPLAALSVRESPPGATLRPSMSPPTLPSEVHGAAPDSLDSTNEASNNRNPDYVEETQYLEVTINGQPLPVSPEQNQVHHVITSGGHTTDVVITMESLSTSVSDTASSTTDIFIDTSSTERSTSNINRGSPQQ